MQYDIEEFYPSISEDLLKKTLDRVRTFVDISREEEENNTNIRMKRECNKYFDVTMASFDGAEVLSWLGFKFYIY